MLPTYQNNEEVFIDNTVSNRFSYFHNKQYISSTVYSIFNENHFFIIVYHQSFQIKITLLQWFIRDNIIQTCLSAWRDSD